jgi:hypothetical protein
MLRTFNRPASMRTPIEVGRRELRRASDRNGYARRSAGRRLAALSLNCEGLGDSEAGSRLLLGHGQALRRARLLREHGGVTDWATRRRVGWL